MMTTYKNYYQKTYEQYQTELKGFKRVLGATGLGKTWGIYEFVQWLRQQKQDIGIVYTTHRHNLIKEMEDKFKVAPPISWLKEPPTVPYVYLKSQQDTVCEFINAYNRDNEYQDLETRYQFFSRIGKEVADVKKLISNVVESQKDVKESVNKRSKLRKFAEESLNTEVRVFLSVFHDALYKLYKESKHTHQLLLKENGILWELFPYIKFKYDPQRPVLLATVQKLMNGFFDGQKSLQITDLSGNLIFIDEFENQEEVMLDYLCSQPNMNNMFEFVRRFVERVDVLLSYVDSARIESLDKAMQVVQEFEDDLRSGLRKSVPRKTVYPKLFEFVMARDALASHSKKDIPLRITVFQSRRILWSQTFSIIQDGKVWRIVKSGTANALRSRPLLYVFSRMVESILAFFSDLWQGPDIHKGHVEFDDWIADTFDRTNDNHPGRYREIIRLYGKLKASQRLLKLRARDEDFRESSYYKGMTLYTMTRQEYANNPDAVDVQQTTLLITPEHVWWRLCNQNLVYGLSATGDLPRVVNTFDMNWIEQQPNVFIPEDQMDKDIIKSMIEAKDNQRGQYKVNYLVEVSAKLEASDKLEQFLENLKGDGFFIKDEMSQTNQDKAISFRKDLVSSFLKTIRWIVTDTKNQAHLIFVNSFTFVKKLLDKKVEMHDKRKDDPSHWMTVEQIENKQEYQLNVNGVLCRLVLLNAAKMKDENPEPFLLGSAENLIILTQFATASLGVNLEWCKTSQDNPLDFEGLHILEPKPYYFDTEDNEDSKVDILKKNIWKLNKLQESGNISEEQFNQILSQDQKKMITAFNFDSYHKTFDYQLNFIGLMEQVFGRIERQRYLSTTTIDVRVSQEVHLRIANYLRNDGAMGKRRDDRAEYVSTFIRKVYDKVKEKAKKVEIKNQYTHQIIKPIQEVCQADIERIVRIISEMREGKHQGKEREIIDLWYGLREAMLKQDYQFEPKPVMLNTGKLQIDFHKNFVFEALFLQENDTLIMDKGENTIYPQATNETHPYWLNQYYREFAKSKVILFHFRAKGYSLHYNRPSAQYVFAPHALQAILAGAVGEEALEALLDYAGIELEERHYYYQNANLFELFDMKVKDKPLYLDAKLFGQSTVNFKMTDPNDPHAIRLLQKAFSKWRAIVDHTHDERVKYVVLNIQNKLDNPNVYFNATGNQVDTFKESAVIIVQGCTNPSMADDEYNEGKLLNPFKLFIDEVKNY